jgi:hypothetical protein
LLCERYPIGSQDNHGDAAKVIVKLFFPGGRYTLYVTEGEDLGDDVNLFGYCISALGPDCDEWGYSSLAESSMYPCAVCASSEMSPSSPRNTPLQSYGNVTVDDLRR